MPVFVYRAADQRGNVIDGVMDVEDARTVVDRLQRDAYFPIRVVPQRASALDLGLGGWRSRRVSTRDVVELTQQFAALLSAGLPVDRALVILEELTANSRVRTIVGDVLHSVRGGSSLSDALAKHHPWPFSRLYVNMVRAGEKGGVLEQTLQRLAELLRDAQEFREAMVSAAIYPALLTLVGASAVVFLLSFVIPRFGEIFKDLGQELPPLTQLLLATSDAVRAYWWLIALVAVAAVLSARLAVSNPGAQLAAHRLLLRAPLIGDLVLKTEVARFARVLGTLLRSGVPVIGALTVAREMVGNQVLAAAVERLAEGVKRGAGLAAPMEETGAFPALARHMVRVGEETGRLEEMLLRVADAFEAEVRKLVKRLTALMEPVVILAMGLVVGVIVVAMLMAIFSISDVPF